MTLGILALVIQVVCSSPVSGQDKQPTSFDVLVDQVKRNDAKADFLKLRMAFTQTAKYKPYDEAADKAGKDVEAALERKDYEAALKLAEQILSSSYVDVRAHMASFRACVELGKADQAKHHKYVAEGLLRSILKSGNGKSPGTAYVVISIDEETAVLGALGIDRKGQELITDNGHKIDEVRGFDAKAKQDVRLYFNVTQPVNWLLQQQKGKK